MRIKIHPSESTADVVFRLIGGGLIVVLSASILFFLSAPPAAAGGLANGVGRGIAKGLKAKPASVAGATRNGRPRDVVVSRQRYPETAKHIDDAQRRGEPSVLTLDRANATERRRESLRHVERTRSHDTIGRDRDEYPPAMTREGGVNADVRYINSGDNRGAGRIIGHQARDVPDGERIRVVIGD